jgi:hypothetical protein
MTLFHHGVRVLSNEKVEVDGDFRGSAMEAPVRWQVRFGV